MRFLDAMAQQKVTPFDFFAADLEDELNRLVGPDQLQILDLFGTVEWDEDYDSKRQRAQT